jgi:hypothetical protein
MKFLLPEQIKDLKNQIICKKLSKNNAHIFHFVIKTFGFTELRNRSSFIWVCWKSICPSPSLGLRRIQKNVVEFLNSGHDEGQIGKEEVPNLRAQ